MFDRLSNQQLILDISVNLSRISRFVYEGNMKRANLFWDQVKEVMIYLNLRKTSPKYYHTQRRFERFVNSMGDLKQDKNLAEDILTWANILHHRAELV